MRTVKKYMALVLAGVLSCGMLAGTLAEDIEASPLEEISAEELDVTDIDADDPAEEVTLEELDETDLDTDVPSEDIVPEESEEKSSDVYGTVNWTNKTTAAFDSTVSYTGVQTKTYMLHVPSSGKVTETLAVEKYRVNQQLYDSAGDEIGDSISRNAGNIHTIEYYLVAGDYYFEIWAPYGNETDTNITWHFDSNNETFKESQDNRNNEPYNAYKISTGKTIKGQFAENDDIDYYKIKLNKDGLFRVKVTNKTTSMRINIYNTSNGVNQETTIKRGKNQLFPADSPLELKKGEYFLVCRKDDGSGSYTFTTSFVGKPSKMGTPKAGNVKGQKIKVSWNRANVAGYEVQISPNKNFKGKGTKTQKITKKSTITYTFKNLKKKSTYYVRIRAYKTMSGKKIYSAWSAAKKCKVSK